MDLDLSDEQRAVRRWHGNLPTNTSSQWRAITISTNVSGDIIEENGDLRAARGRFRWSMVALGSTISQALITEEIGGVLLGADDDLGADFSGRAIIGQLGDRGTETPLFAGHV
jgi:hypothetical protein